jgi:hypothetical protein
MVDAASKQSNTYHRENSSPVASAPTKMSAHAVNVFGKRTNCA